MSEKKTSEDQNLIGTWSLRIEDAQKSEVVLSEEMLTHTYNISEEIYKLMEEERKEAERKEAEERGKNVEMSGAATQHIEGLGFDVDSFGRLANDDSDSTDLRFILSGNTINAAQTDNQDNKWEGYQIHQEIGRGGMGVVSEAFQFGLKRSVALKVPHAGEAQRRFVEEAIVTANLTHPNIISVHDLITDSDNHKAMVMQIVEGVPWSERLLKLMRKHPEGLPFHELEQELKILITVAQAISYSHHQGVLHNDLKLSNIMVGDFGDVSVMDWGCSTLNPLVNNPLMLPLVHPKRITSPFGSPVYMSPEQARGKGEDIGPWTDVYLLGGMLYELVTGRPPRGYNEVDIVVSNAIAGIYDELPANISSRLRKVVETSLSSQKTKRYQSALEFVEAIREYLAHHEAEILLQQVKKQLKEIQDVDIQERELLDFVAMHSVLTQCRDLGLVEDADTLIQDLLASFVDTALEKGDLNIAKVYAAFLNDNKESDNRRDSIRKAIRKQESLQQSKVRNRQLLASMLAILFLMLVVVIFSTQMSRSEAVEHKKFAEKQMAIAEQRLTEIEELADIQIHRDLMVSNEQLWPSRPEKVPQIISWIETANELVSRLPRHKEHLELLREKGTDFQDTNGEIKYRFHDPTLQWENNTLFELVTNLESLENRDLPEMNLRLAFATEVQELTIDSIESEWASAIQQITSEPMYQGLTIKPQLGLIPIGTDPVSGLWEFWHPQSGTKPERGENGELVLLPESGVVLILIPGGEFWMGANNDSKKSRSNLGNYDPRARSKEMPSHKVMLDAFFVSKYELTQAQWVRIMGTNPAAYAYGQNVNERILTELHPIEQISWGEADVAMRRLDLTLPTEAQWEYANRAGTTTVYWTGNTVKSLMNATNISDQQSRENGGPESWAVESVLRDPYIVHGPIGQFRANPFGLHDSIGNVWEWCLDNYGEYTLPVKTGSGERVVNDDANPKLFRGGGFRANSIHVRSADRYSIYAKDYRAYDVGVRPAKAIEF